MPVRTGGWLIAFFEGVDRGFWGSAALIFLIFRKRSLNFPTPINLIRYPLRVDNFGFLVYYRIPV